MLFALFGTFLLPLQLNSQTAGVPITGTLGSFEKPNQSKVFFHDGAWWMTARGEDDWYLWKNNGSTWEQGILIDTADKARPDCYVNSQANKLYIALSHTSTSKFILASYASGNWTIDPGYPVEISNFSHTDDNVISFCVDKTGEIWLFRLITGAVETVHSNDNGLTWSAKLPLKSNLNVGLGLTDAVAFQIQGVDYIGVGYAENTTSGIIAEFGFLRHKVGDPETSWVDETSAMGQFPGTDADNHISAITDASGTVYIVTKTSGGRGNVATNGLYKRDDSGWQQFAVNTFGTWTRPAISLDETNNDLYIFGTLESTPGIGLYKKVPLGQESTLIYATEFVVFENGTDKFKNVSVAAHPVDQNIDLLIAVENNKQRNIWFNKLDIEKSTSVAETELDDGAPNTFTLFDVFPNPLSVQSLTAGRGVSIQIGLHNIQNISVQIYNILGQRVFTLVENRMLSPGNHIYTWNGQTGAGRLTPAGVYFVQAESGMLKATQKILILR
jgi:hypothetical protein